MKIYFRLVLAALAATVALAACTKEITPGKVDTDPKAPAAEGSRVIAVSFAPQTKTYLEGLQPKFNDGDSILISNGETLDTCEVNVVGKKATISTDLTGPLTAVYPYKAAGMNDINSKQIDTVLVSTEQSGKFADANICMAKMKDENGESLSFENKTAVFRITTGAGASTKYVEVSAEGFNIANQFPEGSKYKSLDKIHVEVPETNKPSQYFVSILVPDGLKVGDLSFSDGTNVKLISDENLATPVAVNSIYTVTATNWEVIGALKGVLSVSADRKVHFSQGNLYYDGNKFGFEAEQYHFRTYQGKGKCDAKGYSKTSGTDSGHWGLFGWVGESSTAFTSSPQIYGVSTSTTTSDYGNVPGEALKADWGKAIGDDSTWRTLTKDEWCYLLAYDPEKDGFINNSPRYNLFKTGVKVCGVENCIVIAPDGWDISSKPLQKEYDATTWEQAKAAGLVCLPAAGGRDGSSLDDVGVCGYYWSSSARNESRAYFVQFASAAVHAYADGALRRSGFSVRLVTDVSTPAPAESKYVEIEAKYDGTNITKLKWNKQNLSITDSGKKAWKGGNNSAVKVPGTDDDVKVGDYFQWGASYEGYGITDVAKQKPESLLIYTEFTNTGCGDTKDEFTFIGSKQFDQNNAPYGGTSYTKYTSSNEPTLGKSDDVANIILGGNWRMPTKEEFQALFNATYWVWDGTDKGYYVFVPDESHIAGNIDGSIPSGWSKSTALLFFPAAGRGNGTSFSDVGSYGYCWSNTLSPFFPNIACNLDFDISGVGPLVTNFRYCGLSIRPVSD